MNEPPFDIFLGWSIWSWSSESRTIEQQMNLMFYEILTLTVWEILSDSFWSSRPLMASRRGVRNFEVSNSNGSKINKNLQNYMPIKTTLMWSHDIETTISEQTHHHLNSYVGLYKIHTSHSSRFSTNIMLL